MTRFVQTNVSNYYEDRRFIFNYYLKSNQKSLSTSLSETHFT
jgi:hypothetical protein